MHEEEIPTVRVAVMEDKKDFYRLWKICFGDSDAFCDWFFHHRFAPDYSVCLKTEAEIASCMQGFPYSFLIRGREIPGAMLCGVSTHPKQRKKGFMGKIFRYEMNHLHQKGCIVAPHTPAVLKSYFSFGHFPVADAAYLESECIPKLEPPPHIVSIEKKDWKKLYPLYQHFSEKYSGILMRTETDFLRKAADYSADGGEAIAYTVNSQIKGYAFFYKLEDRLVCTEAVAEDGYWYLLMEGLFMRAEGCAFSAKLPPDLYLAFPFAKMKRVQKGVMGLCSVSGLLRLLRLKIPYGFRITDTVVPENNGCFDFQGNTCHDKPVFEISAGHFLQALIGYRSLYELREQIEIYDEEKFEEMDSLLPKQHCYIIDEY